MDSIWTYELSGTVLSNLGAKKVVPINGAKLIMPRSLVKMIVQ